MGSTYTTPKNTTTQNSNQRSPVPGVNGNIFSMLNHVILSLIRRVNVFAISLLVLVGNEPSMCDKIYQVVSNMGDGG